MFVDVRKHGSHVACVGRGFPVQAFAAYRVRDAESGLPKSRMVTHVSGFVSERLLAEVYVAQSLCKNGPSLRQTSSCTMLQEAL